MGSGKHGGDGEGVSASTVILSAEILLRERSLVWLGRIILSSNSRVKETDHYIVDG